MNLGMQLRQSSFQVCHQLEAATSITHQVGLMLLRLHENRFQWSPGLRIISCKQHRAAVSWLMAGMLGHGVAGEDAIRGVC